MLVYDRCVRACLCHVTVVRLRTGRLRALAARRPRLLTLPRAVAHGPRDRSARHNRTTGAQSRRHRRRRLGGQLPRLLRRLCGQRLFPLSGE